MTNDSIIVLMLQCLPIDFFLHLRSPPLEGNLTGTTNLTNNQWLKKLYAIGDSLILLLCQIDITSN